MDETTLIVAGLAMLAIGGLFYAFVYPYLSGDIKAEKRQAALQKSVPRRVSDRSNDPLQRRKQIAESLKELEKKGKGKKLTLDARIAQAGLSWSKQKFYIGSAVMGVLVAGVFYVFTDGLLATAGAAAAGGFGLPRWVLNFLRKRRLKKFLNVFPDAVDVIIRGVKAGLPLGDCMRVIAQEAAEPVRTEFRLALEATALGLSLGEASERIVERVPVPEASFFAIVINIQQKAGGNLRSEERRVGKECRYRWSPYHEKKKSQRHAR